MCALELSQNHVDMYSPMGYCEWCVEISVSVYYKKYIGK